MTRFMGMAAGLMLCAGLCQAQAPAQTGFAWRAALDVPVGTSVARVGLPAGALAQLQSSDARDVRVLNAAGEAVAFAFVPSPKSPAAASALTHSFAALPLYSSVAGTVQPKGSMQVRIEEPGAQRSVWVQMSGSDGTPAPRLNSVLFATKDERQTLTGLSVQANLPANAPVWMSVSSSADLAQWTPLTVRGRLYRFEGTDAPANTTLEFERPVKLEGQYLRLDWGQQEGVSVAAVSGVIAGAAPAAPRLRTPLAAPRAEGSGTVEIHTGFLTPLAGLALLTPRANTLLPVRVLGRNEASQPWRLLAQTVVYRLADGGAEATNPPVSLHGASARWLRIEATNGADLAAAQLQATAEFEPVQLAFLATGNGPFQLAAGRPGMSQAALPLTMIASALGPRKVEDLPEASVGAATVDAPRSGPLARFWPGGVPSKNMVLWVVLLAGVLMLGAVAWSLLRQLRSPPPAL